MHSTSMGILTAEQIQELDTACQDLSNKYKVRHVGVISLLGYLVGDSKKE